MSSKTIAFCAFILFFFIILERLRYLQNNVVINMYFTSELRGRELANRKLFADYLKRFNKSYGPDEIHKRFRHFKKNLKEIERLNDGRNHAVFGVTKFSDRSPQELQQLVSPQFGEKGCESKTLQCDPPRSARRKLHFRKGNGIKDNDRILKRLDWRKKGVVGPIIDQKRCQICWAASIAGVMASMTAIHGHGYSSLSLQQLMDCAFYTEAERTGCRRGRPLIKVFEFLCSTQTLLAREADYPMTLADQKCKHVPGAVSLKSFKNVCNMHKNESKLLEALGRGPVTALVQAYLFFNYESGVISWHCQVREGDLNHAVQIVGYDATSDPPYYIIKNSWGDDWGEGGYARLAIGGNQCGIAYNVGILDVY